MRKWKWIELSKTVYYRDSGSEKKGNGDKESDDNDDFVIGITICDGREIKIWEV